MLVLKDDCEAEILPRLGIWMIALVGVVLQLDAVTHRQPLAGMGNNRSIPRHAAAIEEPDDLRSRHATQLLHKTIDSLASQRRIECNFGELMRERHRSIVICHLSFVFASQPMTNDR